MKHPRAAMYAGLLLATLSSAAFAQARPVAQAPAGNTVPVTVDNFIRAESDMYFGNNVKQGAFGTFYHHRELIPIDKQIVVRFNRDVLVSGAVFDLDAGPVTITLPDPGQRFLSMLVVNQDHYIPAIAYDAGDYTFTRDQVGRGT